MRTVFFFSDETRDEFEENFRFFNNHVENILLVAAGPPRGRGWRTSIFQSNDWGDWEITGKLLLHSSYGAGGPEHRVWCTPHYSQFWGRGDVHIDGGHRWGGHPNYFWKWTPSCEYGTLGPSVKVLSTKTLVGTSEKSSTLRKYWIEN